MIGLLANAGIASDVANRSSLDYPPASTPPPTTVPIESPVRRHSYDPEAKAILEPVDTAPSVKPVGFDYATSFEPWDSYPRFDGSYAVIAKRGPDPSMTGGQAAWDLYAAPIRRGEPMPWDQIGF